MPHSPHRKTDILRSIELLTQVTQRDNLQGQTSIVEAQRQFKMLRDDMSECEHPAHVLLASIGDRLTGYLSKDEAVPVEELRALVTEIAEHIAKEVIFHDDPKAAVGKPSLKMSASEVKLALRDGQRLGELLVKMTMLTPEQVEGAVKVQRATGQRLGEALLQLRLLTPDMLDSALRVQKTKRGKAAKGDEWSTHKPPAA